MPINIRVCFLINCTCGIMTEDAKEAKDDNKIELNSNSMILLCHGLKYRVRLRFHKSPGYPSGDDFI